MILNNKEIEFLKRNKLVIEPMLKTRIEEYKNLILIEEDEAKRDKLIKWVREFQVGIGALYQAEKKDEERFTGI